MGSLGSIKTVKGTIPITIRHYENSLSTRKRWGIRYSPLLITASQLGLTPSLPTERECLVCRFVALANFEVNGAQANH